MNPVAIAAYLILFAGTAFLFVLVAIFLGRLVRPDEPSEEKLATYECGEPAVGSSYVQFDIRFYVVALVFIIFEVELAFFFPWATVFGQVVRASAASPSQQAEQLRDLANPAMQATQSEPPAEDAAATLRQFALAAMIDLAAFFGVLLVGFAYLWRRGDLNWIRATREAPAQPRVAIGDAAA
jgi:NADH-quinone oxidoreductase subunit A